MDVRKGLHESAAFFVGFNTRKGYINDTCNHKIACSTIREAISLVENHYFTAMKCKLSALFSLLFFTINIAIAQTDKWTGTWQMSRKPYADSSTAIIMNLQIGIPDQQQLYPAKIKLQYGHFSGTYEMLLVRKNDEQIAIVA